MLAQAPDTCEIVPWQSSNDDYLRTVIPGQSFGEWDSVSAGDVIVVTGENGTVAQIEPESLSLIVEYEAEDVPYDDPRTLVFPVPGDEFPAVESPALPAGRPYQHRNFVGRVLDLREPVTWGAPAGTSVGKAAEGLMHMGMDVEVYRGGQWETEYLRCVMVDDGEFDVPASIVDGLRETSYDTADVEMGVEVRRTIEGPDATLVVTRWYQ